MIWLGVDGGGTKTEAVVGNENGVLALARGGPSNHQGVGMDAAVEQIRVTVGEALKQSHLAVSRVDQSVLGLAGADFSEDIEQLSRRLATALPRGPFTVVNDAEIALHAGTDQGWGIAAVAGTGGNVFGQDENGRSRQVGGLGYEYGDYGSAIDIARDALHHAFRSAEHRGVKTVLEDQALAMLGFWDFAALSRAMYRQEIEPGAFLVLAPLCFAAAMGGDSVAQDILSRQGRAIAESVAGCARLLNMTEHPVDVVLAGSLWLGQAPHMKDQFFQTLSQELPLAAARITELRPVAGALLMAAGPRAPWLRGILRQDARFSGVE